MLVIFMCLFNSRKAALVAILAVLPMVALPVAAQSTKERLSMLEQRMQRIERIVTNNDSETDMLRRLQALQAENEALRNEIETLQFSTVQSADRQRQLYIDLDQRLQAIEVGGLATAGGTGAAATGSGLTGSDSNDYQAGFELLKAGRYPEASVAFQQFLAAYSDSDLRDNAQYWLAETDYVTQDFEAALENFKKVVSDYPASRKIPDAWLKIGFCNYELGKRDEAQQALNVVKSRYPETTAARLAAQRLELMQTESR
jgi:tol-pal system protein YbgF